jgi:putative nucleotidyltransferase with HDIG domain
MTLAAITGSMKKKIGVQHLRLGMYVSELDRPWIESRFLFQGFELRTQEELDELLRLCKYVYVETEVEYKDGQLRPRQPLAAGTPDPKEFAAKRLGFEILDKFSDPRAVSPSSYPDRAVVEEELPQAQELVKDTRELVDNILEDTRLGRSLDSRRAKKTVGGIVQSVLRNPDALIWYNQLKNKDSYTSEHSLRVCVFALAFGRHLELSEPELNILGIGALLHDIGKMKVPPEIINKPGALTPQEFELMKSHVPRGVEILERTPGIPPVAIDVARSHHERFDGSGYAYGLKGSQISLFGQIGAIVDSYDAITSDRPYHKGMSPHDALRKMYEWRRKDFHETLVEQFIQCMGIYPIGSVVEMNTGSIGVVIAANRTRRLRPRVALVLDPAKQPYKAPRVIDLTNESTQGHNAVLIRNVLPAGSFGINPVDYLPLPA